MALQAVSTLLALVESLEILDLLPVERIKNLLLYVPKLDFTCFICIQFICVLPNFPYKIKFVREENLCCPNMIM